MKALCESSCGEGKGGCIEKVMHVHVEGKIVLWCDLVNCAVQDRCEFNLDRREKQKKEKYLEDSKDE
jgi:hypothetical protein